MTPLNPTLHAGRRLTTISRWMAASCALLMLILPLGLAWYWASSGVDALAAHANLPSLAVRAPLQPWQRWAAALVTAVALAPMLAGLWQARSCFALFARGQVFTRQAVRHLVRFAAWALAAALADILAGAVVSVLLTWGNPPGQRHLALGIGSQQLFAVFFAGVVWLMAAVIEDGQAVAEENASFV